MIHMLFSFGGVTRAFQVNLDLHDVPRRMIELASLVCDGQPPLTFKDRYGLFSHKLKPSTLSEVQDFIDEVFDLKHPVHELKRSLNGEVRETQED